MSWIGDILDSTKTLEAPKNFYYWSGLSAISAVVKDNVWMNRGDVFNLYPNIYVMLHAESGLKKGPPISLAKDVVQLTKTTRIISGRSSIQGILKELGQTTTLPGGKIPYGGKSIAYIVSSELTSSLVEDKAAATILTDLYDRHYNNGQWKSLLKMESFELKDPTITMLTATNEAHSDDFFAKRDIEGGYFARTFIIAESKRNTINSLVIPIKNPPNRDKLSEYLKTLANLKGAFKPIGSRERNKFCTISGMEDGEQVYFSNAGKYYNDWYIDFCNTIDEQQIKDETGTLNRFGDSVLKVAMLLSLAESTEMIIELHHMEEAIAKCERLIGNIRKTTFGKKGKSVFAAQKTILLEELLNRPTHMISRAQLLKKFWMHANDEEWDKVARTLNDANLLTIEQIGANIVYRMTDKQVVELADWMMGKNTKETIQ